MTVAVTVKVTKARKKGKKGRKIGNRKKKCERYRLRVGKPRGPGMPGTKSGKNWRPRVE